MTQRRANKFKEGLSTLALVVAAILLAHLLTCLIVPTSLPYGDITDPKQTEELRRLMDRRFWVETATLIIVWYVLIAMMRRLRRA